MTKYILHGGNTSKKNFENDKFFSEMLAGFNTQINILCVYFASEKEKWGNLLTQDNDNFKRTSPKIKFNLTIASDDPNKFTQQAELADLIYLRGGKTEKLKSALAKIRDISSILKDKTISGSSAGAYVLSRYYYSNSKDDIFEGFGILPIKTFCHYDENKTEQLKRLKNFGEELPVYAIPDEKYFVIKQ